MQLKNVRGAVSLKVVEKRLKKNQGKKELRAREILELLQVRLSKRTRKRGGHRGEGGDLGQKRKKRIKVG